MMTEMSWEVDEEVNQDENGEADGMNLEVDSKVEVMHNLNERSVIFLLHYSVNYQKQRQHICFAQAPSRKH